MCFFFYGTLRDIRVRQAVLGRIADRLKIEPAHLDDWRCVRLKHEVYPVIVPYRGDRVDGCILREPLPASAVVRLDRFEGTGYRRARLPVTPEMGGQVHAQVFIATGRLVPTAHPWNFEEWVRRHGDRYLRTL